MPGQRAVGYHELRSLFETKGRDAATREIVGALKAGTLKPTDFSLKELFEASVTDGAEFMRHLNPAARGRVSLTEAAGAVDTSAFSKITGQIAFTEVLAGFEDPQFIGGRLCKTTATAFSGEKVPGIGNVGDEAEIVDEGRPYPLVGLSQRYIETPQTVKRGMIIPLTREAIFFDRTGLLLERARKVGQYLGVNKEKRIIDNAVGVTNTYKQNGTTLSTYQTSTPWINSVANTLTSWDSVRTAEMMLNKMTDPETGEPIIMKANTVLVPQALFHKARMVFAADQVGQVDNQANSSTIRTFAPNPVASTFWGGTYEIVTSPYVYNRTTSDATWFLGDFMQAFRYMQNWDIGYLEAPKNSEAEFTHDIAFRMRVDERGVPATYEPRCVTKNT